MTPVKVHFYASMRPIVGAKTVDIAAPEGATVRELVDAIVAQHPGLGPLLQDETGGVPRGVHVFVNGRGAGYLERGYETRLSADDSVDLFPAVAGG
jgi:molybdopterin synthase sulfur carrier subunit